MRTLNSHVMGILLPAIIVATGCSTAAKPKTASPNSADAAAARKLAFSGPLSQAPSICGLITIQVSDATGTAVAATTAVTLALKSSSSTGAFFSDTGCTKALASAQIAIGQSSATSYYKDTVAGSPTLTATDASSTFAAATMAATIGANKTTTSSAASGTANKFVFTSTALSQSASACGLVKLQLQDPTSTPAVAAAATPITMKSSSATGLFYSDAACVLKQAITLPLGSSAVTLYYKDTTDGSPTLTASDDAGAITSGTQVETIGAGGSIVGTDGTCWGAGGPGQATYILSSQADAISCAQHIATKNSGCAAAARYGQVSCPSSSSTASTPSACSCNTSVTTASWTGTPSKP